MIDTFNFVTGRILSGKYQVECVVSMETKEVQVIERLGAGWEGEVYLVKEVLTGIERAAKFFFPHRDPNNKSLIVYAQKLHKL